MVAVPIYHYEAIPKEDYDKIDFLQFLGGFGRFKGFIGGDKNATWLVSSCRTSYLVVTGRRGGAYAGAPVEMTFAFVYADVLHHIEAMPRLYQHDKVRRVIWKDLFSCPQIIDCDAQIALLAALTAYGVGGGLPADGGVSIEYKDVAQ